ncbi:MAG TPA: ferritin-like domain-containing protein [Longimicrobiaceae bacterium]|nr:ferritin-like domain-containing protein [Longimicrobiaceae bacterium]
MTPDLIRELQGCRSAEKGQALYYRALAAEAERRGDDALSERFNELHADEQHHVSRLTARLLELGAAPEDLSGLRSVPAAIEGWEEEARSREAEEVRRYEALAARDLDGATAELVREILETERHHARELGGKWTPA